MGLFDKSVSETNDTQPIRKEVEITDQDRNQLFSVRDRQTRAALDILKSLAKTFLSYPEYHNSPVVENIGLAFESDKLEKDITIMSQEPTRIRRSFNNSWNHYLKMLGLAKNQITGLINLSVQALNFFTSPGNLKPSDAFNLILKTEKNQAIKKEIPENETITGRAGTFDNSASFAKSPDINPATTLQRGLGQAVICFLNNQSVMAGFYDGKKYDSGKKAEIAKNLLTKLGTKPHGWMRLIKNQDVADDLNKHCQIVENKRHYDTHDQALIFNEAGKFDLDNLKIDILGLDGLPVRLYSSDGTKYANSTVRTVFSMSTNTLNDNLSTPDTSNAELDWKNISQESDEKSWPLFALSLSSERKTNPTNPAANGRTLYHLHLDTHSDETLDTLQIYTGHLKDDAMDQSWAQGKIVEAIGREVVKPNKPFIRLNSELPAIENQANFKNLNPEAIVEKIAPRDVTVGNIFDSKQLGMDLFIINSYSNNQGNGYPLQEIFKSEEYNKAFALAKHKYHLPDDSHEEAMGQMAILRKMKDYPKFEPISNQGNIAKNIKSLLYPFISRADIFGMVAEKQGPVAICNYPISFLKRLALSLVKKPKSERLDNPTSMDEAVECLKSTATDRVLSRLGIGPLAFLTTFTAEVQKLAENSASFLSKAIVEKTMITTQISDIVESGLGYFTSALSSYRRTLARSIGITENRITSRCNLSKMNFVNTLDFTKELSQDEIKITCQALNIREIHLRSVNHEIKTMMSQSEKPLENRDIIAQLFRRVPADYAQSYGTGLQAYLVALQVRDLDQLIEDAEQTAATLATHVSNNNRAIVSPKN